MPNLVYADHAATAPVKPQVLEAMLPYLKENYANPSSLYPFAYQAKIAVDTARKQVADLLHASDKEIYFTSCGSESDNWAIKGAVEASKHEKPHVITTAIEHHAVLHTCQALEKRGVEVTYLGVDAQGLISLDELKAAIRPETVLISVMFANNEIGTIQPIAEIGAIAKEHGVLFHTDAVQAVGHVEIDVEAMNIDILSLSGHKFGTPKGIGAMYLRKGVRIGSFIHGGGQERGKRAGTENTAYAAAMAAALSEATAAIDKKAEYIRGLRDKLIKGVMETIPYTKLNGHPTLRQAGNANFSFKYIEGESLLLWLDMNGIAASSGSACTSGSLDPSHVLLAIGLPHEIAHGSLRISIGENNTEEEVDTLLKVLPEIVEKLRKMSPLYEGVEGGNE